MVDAVYCGRCKKLFSKDKTCRIKTEFDKYSEEFDDDYCEECTDVIEKAICGIKST